MNNNFEFKIEVIIEEYSDYVFKIINNIVGTSLSYQDKEEIAADAFYLLWKNQHKITDNMKSYLATITRNCSYEKLRKNKITYEYKEEYLYEETKDFDLEKREIMKEKVNRLSEKDKRIFELFYVKGYKIKEISQSLHLTTGNIKFRLYTIRKKLKEELK